MQVTAEGEEVFISICAHLPAVFEILAGVDMKRRCEELSIQLVIEDLELGILRRPPFSQVVSSAYL